MPTSRIYGEAHCFYTVCVESLGTKNEIHLAIYAPLLKLNHSLNCTIQGSWPTASDMRVIECKHIHSIVGIWAAPSKRVYVLRKHPGLGMLSEDELGRGSKDDDAQGNESIAL